jgi:hypothetical protein
LLTVFIKEKMKRAKLIMSKEVTITLPSFLRRVFKAYALKAHIRSVGGDLHRIGRSRNWQLKVLLEKIPFIIEKIEQDNEASWLWVIKLLKKQNELLSHEELIAIAKRKPNITVNQLLKRTDCTIAQARKVIDELEDF